MGESPTHVFARNGFDVKIKDGAVVSLRYLNDLFDTEYIWPERRLGDVDLAYRKPDGKWQRVQTEKLAGSGMERIPSDDTYAIDYRVSDGEITLTVGLSYDFTDKGLIYSISLANESSCAVEIGDIALPFPMNGLFEWGKDPNKCVLRHSFVSGHNSYMFWMRPNSVGPYLLLTTMGRAKLEYFDLVKEGEFYIKYSGKPLDRVYRAFIHSRAQGEIAREEGCNWRQANTSVLLSPKGEEGDSVAYSFKYQWVRDYSHIRSMLAEEGLIDIQVIPGMTVPTDLFAKFYLRTNEPIHAIEAEYPEETELRFLETKAGNFRIYEVKFQRLGENILTVKYGQGKHMVLEFFVTEPIETLIKKRGAFITKCQHRDPAKWYNGLISEWNMETRVLLGPDNYDRIKGWRIYAVTCDDPGLSKPSFLAAKNAEYPVQEEVEALDYYIDNFVWGGLQMTDEEEYPTGSTASPIGRSCGE